MNNNKEDDWDWDDGGGALSPFAVIGFIIMCIIACFRKDGEEWFDRLFAFPPAYKFDEEKGTMTLITPETEPETSQQSSEKIEIIGHDFI